MITMTITYPHDEGASFDWDYFADKHLPAVGNAFKPFGLNFASVLQGIEGVPGGPPAYIVTVILNFSDDRAARNAAASDGARELMADVANFTTVKPLIQFNRMVS